MRSKTENVRSKTDNVRSKTDSVRSNKDSLRSNKDFVRAKTVICNKHQYPYIITFKGYSQYKCPTHSMHLTEISLLVSTRILYELLNNYLKNIGLSNILFSLYII